MIFFYYLSLLREKYSIKFKNKKRVATVILTFRWMPKNIFTFSIHISQDTSKLTLEKKIPPSNTETLLIIIRGRCEIRIALYSHWLML
jgi:hypothetical protein